ncbi:MAG: fibronectin type III domain-containing protein [Muribaculaceae bacterium]|nr:fibronectin type III domain-containing protein [Roseburia sp.]MCM1429951.1 fibronectin type III domain-containing protein [Muribaculaceae bacterium]MCM1493022.1 fibronectin type III domain-containing protein [Muribaculaceae bacterium]
MKRYICMFLTLCLMVCCPVFAQTVQAEETQKDNQKSFIWSITAEAGTSLDEEGDVIPAIALDFSGCSNKPDYIEIYRATGGSEDYEKITTYICLGQTTYRYTDRTVVPRQVYDYYAVAGWYRTLTEEAYTSEPSSKVSMSVELRRPVFEAQSGGTKSIRLLLPASGFSESYPYVSQEGSGIYATGFQIYRSRREDSGYKQIAEVSADTAGYRDTSVTKGKLYFYKVRTYYYDKATGTTYTGEFSDKRMCSPGANVFPDADTLNLDFSVKSGSTAKITWENADGFVADALFVACRDAGASSFSKVEEAELSKKAKSYTLKNVKENCEYEVRLLIRIKTPYNDGNNFYYDSRWYVKRFYT